MKISDAIKMYGEGDNSTTDRMWYESACEICIGITNLKDAPDIDKVFIIAVSIALAARPNKTITEDAVKSYMDKSKVIFSRLNSMGTSYTSRISVEYVRQQLENILKK